MLTADGCSARRRRLWEALPSPCDLIVLADPQSLAYFAGYTPSPFTFRTNGDAAVLVLTPDRASLVGDNLLTPFLEASHVDEVVDPVWYDGKRSAPDRRSLLVRSVRDTIARTPGTRIGLEPGSVPSGVIEGVRGAREGVDLVDLALSIGTLRRRKDPDELDLLRRAIRAGDAGMAAALEHARPGRTEFETFQAVERACLAEAGRRAIVYGDFVSGPRCRTALGPPEFRDLVEGELYIFDFSVVLDGYRGDTANTLVVGGRPTPRQEELYRGCLAAIEAGEAMLRPGVAARDVDAAVRRALFERGLDGDFPSHCGHGLGLSHPEAPFIVPESEDHLVEGDVVTLEPAQYGEDFGGMRYEHNYLITADGFETLSQHRLSLTP